MSRTKVRTWLFRDPLLRKGHAHTQAMKAPDPEEELEEWLEERYREQHQRDEDERGDHDES
jgi:hypothetical protein